MFGPAYTKAAKSMSFPKHKAFRPVGNEHDSAKQDSSMESLASNIASERGQPGSMSKEYVYKRMEQKQRMNINKFGDSHQSQKKLMKFYTHQMGGVYDSKQLSKMYGIYQDGEEKMFETIRPMNMQKGDMVYNNLMGEIGILQDNQNRGEDCILVFQDRSIRVNKAVSGWSKKLITTDESAPVAASSAAGPALFKEQIDESTKNNPKNPIDINGTMKKIIEEVNHQDDPHCVKNDCEGMMKGMSIEKEHIDVAEKIWKHEIKPIDAPFEIAKDHIEENPEYYSKLNKNKKGKEFLIKQDESEDEDDDFEDEDEEEFADDSGMSQKERKAAGLFKPMSTGQPHVSPTASPQLAKQLSSFPHEQFRTLAKEHNISPGSKMRLTSFDKSKNQEVSHFGTYRGPGKDIGIPKNYNTSQLHSYFNKNKTQNIKTDSGVQISHYKPTERFKPVETHDIPDVSHHEYIKGLISKHKETLDNPKISDETKSLASEHIAHLSKHLETYKGETGQHGPSEKMSRFTQYENSTMHLLGRHPSEDMVAPYSDAITAHSKFKEKYKRDPEVIVHTMPTGAKHKYDVGNVTHQEKESHLQQLTSVKHKAGSVGGIGPGIGSNKTFSLGAKELTHKAISDGGYAYKKNKEGTNQRTQMVAVGKVGSQSDAEKGTYHGIYEHKAFPTNLKGSSAEIFVKHRQYEHGSKRFNLESPIKQNITKQKEMKAQSRIGSGNIKYPKSPEQGNNMFPTPIENMTMDLKPHI